VLNAPDPEAERLLQAAARAYAGGDKPGAAALARQVLLRRPGDGRALQLLGAVALDAGEFAAARRHLEASNAAHPNAATLNMIGVAAKQLGDAAAARAAFKRAGELGLAEGWRNLALAEAGDADAVIGAYQKALTLAPDDPAAHAGLAQAYEARHDVVRAREHADAALKRDGANAVARLALARVLMREKNFAAAEAALAPIAQSPRAPAEQRILALGLIGDARDRTGDAAAAFEAFTAANQLSLQINRAWLSATERLYHPDNVRRVMSSVEAWAPAPAVPRAFETPAPVFLVGFPRSGTTLLDQILSSHSAIVCLEESEHFSDAVGAVLTTAERAWDINGISDVEVDQIREGYWRRVRRAANIGDGALVIDKFPLNIVVLPWIKRVFPDAKIIFALRDPRDVILSCFQQRFGMNAAMAQFLQLDTAAAYYDQVMTLMQLCRDRLALDLHQVRYEDVVADLDGSARQLSSFLGVAYEERMLDFRATALKRDIATPSARQVIEPLYNRSVERWRRYEAQLAPVLPRLSAWAERYGYPV
jgi:tetratricopeptide (TPR) repeat protein